MILILTEPADSVGSWLADGLQARLPIPVHHLTTEALTAIASVETEQSGESVEFRIHLASGFILDSRMITGVVNRVLALPPGLALRRGTPDRTSAVRNFSSPVWRLLSGFPGAVLNRPSAQGLSGDFRLPSEWAALAQDAGLAPLRWNPERTESANRPDEEPGGWRRVAVIGDDVVPLDDSGRLPAAVERCCRAFAASSASDVIGVDLVRFGRSEWHFADVDFRPDLERGGRAALMAVARVLAAASRRGSGPDSRNNTTNNNRPARGADAPGRSGSDAGRADLVPFRYAIASADAAFRAAWWRMLTP